MTTEPQTQLTLYQVADICKPSVYRKIIEQEDSIVSLKDFIEKIGLREDMFRIDEFWDGWKHKARYMVVNKDLLDWLGYEGEYKHQRQAIRKLLVNNFKINSDYIYDGHLEVTMLIGPDKKRPKEKLLAISWICLKEISMMLQTDRASEVRKIIITQEVLFGMYSQYKENFMVCQRDKTINELNMQLLIRPEQNTKECQISLENTKKQDQILLESSLVIGDVIIKCRSDGKISLTQMAKASGRRYNDWFRIDSTQAYLKALNLIVGLPVIEIIESEPGRYGGSWGHPLVAINFAQWCSPDIAVQVSKWVWELSATGKVELGKEKSIQEIESVWKEKVNNLQLKCDNQQKRLQEKDEVIETVTTENKKLKKKAFAKEKSHRFVPFGINQAAYYIFNYGRRCHSDCILKNLRKHGIAIKDKNGSAPFDRRLRQHRTTFRWLYLEFIITGPPNCIEIVEKAMEEKYGINLNPSSSEVFESVDLNVLKSSVISLLDIICPGNYNIISQDKIDTYNEDVNNMIKEGIEPIEDEDDNPSSEQENSPSRDQINNQPILVPQTVNSHNNNTTNNIDTNIQNLNITINLDELKQLLQDLDSFTIKRLDPLLEKYSIPKHGTRAKKIAKLRDFIREKIRL